MGTLPTNEEMYHPLQSEQSFAGSMFTKDSAQGVSLGTIIAIIDFVAVAHPTRNQRQYHNCIRGLQATNKNMAAVNRAIAAWNTLQTAADANNVDPALLAAIGVRETGFQNVSENDNTGVGVGVFQITVSSRSGVTAAQAGNLTWAANYAAALLDSNMDNLGSRFPNFNPAQLLQASVAAYNMNPDKPGNFTGNPNTIDKGTTGNNYGSNVVQLMDCF